jgi:putative transcriptional regulator
MARKDPTEATLAGMMLLAMPTMTDDRFARTVIYLCNHTSDGAMGLIVNQHAESVRFPTIIEQLGIESSISLDDKPVHIGGPVESSRGFVLHSPDYVRDSTRVIDENFALTATVDILRAMATGRGPRQSVFALGYAGWAPGQLDAEIQQNGWLIAKADADLVFGTDNGTKWDRALRNLGIDPALLSTFAGHA